MHEFLTVVSYVFSFVMGTMLIVSLVAALISISEEHQKICDAILYKLNERRKRIDDSDKARKLWKIKLLSDNKNEIKEFLEKNVNYLPQSVIDKFYSKLEYLNSNEIIKKFNM